MKRQGLASILFVAFFLIFIGLGVLWYALRRAVGDVSTTMLDQYPSGIYDPNTLSIAQFMISAIPFFFIISILIFVYIGVKKKSVSENQYV